MRKQNEEWKDGLEYYGVLSDAREIFPEAPMDDTGAKGLTGPTQGLEEEEEEEEAEK
ncbi:hypothetical protein LJK88_31850 [Paenibacillus sp. P26]|nr:hypothetical protein LJK88_31850 [Paenibacillus sp. P26]UUZ94207.1 hypothetical protein LJK87_06225 [Paenibacillus sp. P25]